MLRRPATPLVAATLTALLLFGAAFAVARSSSTVGARSSFAVDGKGHTLYTLSGETTKHLKCKSKACLSLWPPLTVSGKAKPTAASGVDGKLGVLRRADGRRQVTLRGKPVYRYSGDSAAGDRNGEGIQTFGGTWHAVTARAGQAPAPSPAPSPSPSYPPYY